MAVAFVSFSDATFAGGSGSVTAPAGIVTGNLLVAIVGGAGSSAVSAPAGWTMAGAVSFNADTNVMVVYTKTATGSEAGSYAFGAGTSTGAVWVGQYSGGITLDDGPTYNSASSGTTLTVPSRTPTVTGDGLIAAWNPSSGQTVSTPTGMTAHNTAGSFKLKVFDQILASTTPTGTINSTGGSSGFWMGVSLLVKAAATLVTGTAAVAVGPLHIASTPGVIGACLRKAWLTLGDLDVSLEDPQAGYFCTQLDLGYAVREVISNNPDRDGAQDRTQYLGSRAVTANITTLAGAGGRIDQVAASFAPFMLPNARPTLHYVLDRPGLPERTLTVRAAGYSWPISGPYQRDIQLQWIASDPVARDPNLKTATALIVGSSSISTPGDVPVRPLFRITGPLTAPSVGLGLADPPYTTWFLAFQSSFTIPVGHYIEIDTENRTVFYDGDPAKPRLASMDWTVSSWQWIAPLPSATIMSLTGTGDGPGTRVDAIWQDGYVA